VITREVATILQMDMEAVAQVDTMAINQNATSKPFFVCRDKINGHKKFM
jgi:hypothetical protein